MGPRILLLQDAVYLPSYGGGNKANRLLLTALAVQGFECHAIARLPGTRRVLAHHFSIEGLAARGVAVTAQSDGSQTYRHQGVAVMALDFTDPALPSRLAEQVRRIDPDWILVSDDRAAGLLDVALHHAPDRVVALVHTHFHLPFGPDADTPDPVQHAHLARARGIVVVSQYSRAYLRDHGGLDATVLHFPVFGAGPFAAPERPDTVLMMNPCLIKGLPIFLDLAARFPNVAFAAVPTWGSDTDELAALARLANVRLLEPADDIDAVLRHVRILLAPSLVPETFGYAAMDAMLRGIPVLSGNLGAQPEAKLGAGFVLPVAAARRTAKGYIAPPQPVAAWRDALELLLTDGDAYRRCAEASRAAALRFLPKTDVRHFIRYLEGLGVQ